MKKAYIAIAVALSLAAVVLFIATLAALKGVSDGPASADVAHIKIRGVITTEQESLLGTATASAEDVADLIRKADSAPSISVIILDINSPGGSAVASDELARAVSGAEKPVVALIRDIGASGAYWAASSSDFIVASPLSITGSIGATASYLEFSGLFEKYGIGYERIVSGDLKDAGTPFRRLTGEEEELMQEMIDLTGRYFAESVRENRNLSDEVAEAMASGRIYTGQQAAEIGLVDRLGSMDAAREVAAQFAEAERVRLVSYETSRPFSLQSILSRSAAEVGRSVGASLLPERKGISLT